MAWVHRRRMAPAHAELRARHATQLDAWEARSERFEQVLGAIAPYLETDFLQPLWAGNLQPLEDYLRPRPPFEFLSSTTLMETMVMVNGGRPFRRELAVCARVWEEQQLAALAEEDLAGDPVLHSRRPLTSHTRIHHLHTLARYELAIGSAYRDAAVALEWGGGFGGMARVLRRLRNGPQTLIIIDLPIMSALQWLYLGVTLGSEEVHLVDRPGAGIAEGRVNIVPNGLIDEIDVEPEAFISTWALGESEPPAHAACSERGWLEAPRLIVADQRSGVATANSDRVLELAAATGARLERIETVPGSFFAFR